MDCAMSNSKALLMQESLLVAISNVEDCITFFQNQGCDRFG